MDPRRDRSAYLATAESLGWTISATVETHLHADFISGGRELQAVGSILYAPRGADLVFDHRLVDSGEDVDLGGLTLSALATPGHTPEHLAYLLSDDSTPLALFSGGSLLVGAVARTDLIAPDQTEDLARRLFRSLREVLHPLPDDLNVYPTHGAGSFCTAGVTGDRGHNSGCGDGHQPLISRSPTRKPSLHFCSGASGPIPVTTTTSGNATDSVRWCTVTGRPFWSRWNRSTFVD